MYKIFRHLLHAAAIAIASLAVTTNPASAGILFSEDFENPHVDPNYIIKDTSQKVNEAKWVRASIGFGSRSSGIVNEGENGGANFTDPNGSQAYASRYTNSGVTTAEGVIGTLTAGVTYTVSFDVVVDGWNKGGEYSVGLVTFASGADRNNVSANGITQGTSAALAMTKGIASEVSYAKKSFSYTADGSEKSLGQDLAIRILGSSSSANIDNLSVNSNSDGEGNRLASGDGGDFSEWISKFPGVGDQTTFNDDADGDGIVNGLENFFGTAPDVANTGILANSGSSGGGKEFTFTHPENPTRANNISEASYQWTTDQANYHPSGASVGGTTVTFTPKRNTPTAGITTVTGLISGKAPEKISVNLIVTLEP